MFEHAHATYEALGYLSGMVVLESLPLEPGATTPAQSKSFDKAENTVGRSPEAAFVLDGARISRLAIRVVVTADQIVFDDQSENGSSINGERGWGTRPMREEDDIQVGPYRLVVRRIG